MSAIGRAWKGYEKLWKVFWVYGVIVGVVIGLISETLKSAGSIVVIGFVVFQFVYYIWLTVAQWRCAFNVGWAFWGYLVRGMIALSLLFFVVGLVIGGGLVGKDLLSAAECRRDLKAYIAQGGTDAEGFKQKCLQEKTAGMNSAPPVAPTSVPADDATHEQTCLKSMADHAKDRNIEPQQYIAENQQYLKECIQYYKNATTP